MGNFIKSPSPLEVCDKVNELGGQNADKSQDYSAVLSASNWNFSSSSYHQTLTILGIIATNKPIIGTILSPYSAPALEQVKAWNLVNRAVTGKDSIEFICLESAPQVDIPIQIKVVS